MTTALPALVTSLRALLNVRGIERLYVQRDDNDLPVGMLMDGLGNVAFHYEEEDQALAERIVALIAAAPELLDAHEALRKVVEVARPFAFGCSEMCDLPLWGENGDECRPDDVPPCDRCELLAVLKPFLGNDSESPKGSAR